MYEVQLTDDDGDESLERMSTSLAGSSMTLERSSAAAAAAVDEEGGAVENNTLSSTGLGDEPASSSFPAGMPSTPQVESPAEAKAAAARARAYEKAGKAWESPKEALMRSERLSVFQDILRDGARRRRVEGDVAAGFISRGGQQGLAVHEAQLVHQTKREAHAVVRALLAVLGE
jgi:hypothetical protein